MNQSDFEDFHEQTATQLWAYIIRICGNRELSKDILQESYLRFLQRPPNSNDFAAMKSYLYTIATRLNIDRLKSSGYRRLSFYSFFGEEREPASDFQMKSSLRIDMDFVFHLLKPKERAILWLAYVEEHPHDSIAHILGCKKPSVKVMLFRARRKLTALLKQYKVDEEHGYE
ncbi:MAG: RNA polymerase sigma factor [Calditrichia bacterium]